MTRLGIDASVEVGIQGRCARSVNACLKILAMTILFASWTIPPSKGTDVIVNSTTQGRIVINIVFVTFRLMFVNMGVHVYQINSNRFTNASAIYRTLAIVVRLTSVLTGNIALIMPILAKEERPIVSICSIR